MDYFAFMILTDSCLVSKKSKIYIYMVVMDDICFMTSSRFILCWKQVAENQKINIYIFIIVCKMMMN
jgi:hypothetical protein